MADNTKSPKDSKPEKTAAKKAEKKSNDNKPNVLKKIKQFFKDVRGETKKISWTSGPETMKNTGVVLMVTLVIGAGVWIVDVLFRELIDLIYTVAGSGTAEAAVMTLSGLL